MWMTDVLPALLPFFICANFLQNIGIMRYLKSGVFPFVMSVLSGYPMGAKIIGDLRRRGEISLSEAKRLVSFCSTSGPAFMMGAVGVGMLGSAVGGAVIAAAHYIGAAVNGILYTRVLGRGEKDHEKKRSDRTVERCVGVVYRSYNFIFQISWDNIGIYSYFYFCDGYDTYVWRPVLY